MPSITINGVSTHFTPGQTILQVSNRLHHEEGQGVEIPQYCYHDGLSVVASCRICLVECAAPNAKTGQLEPYMGGKLLPSCQTPAVDGMVVYSDSPKAVQNQKAVMEYLLINHPLDCPVCDQSGECYLQDYSYQFGRGTSRFEEQKVKQPKKDIGPHVYLYSDRCIMCTRCVRFTREVTGTAELSVQGRGNKEEIDVFPGVPLDNPLASNVIDLCPVGALLDKDFLFAQRVWFLKETPSIDGITASGDNIYVHHNEGKVYRIKPRTNLKVNRWWITDEVRYGWKFVHAENRLRSPMRKQFGTRVECDFSRAYDEVIEAAKKSNRDGKRLAVLVSPMLTCEEAFVLGQLARRLDQNALLAVGPVPMQGSDVVYPKGAKPDAPNAFTVCAEKAPNARGVRRALSAIVEPSHVSTYESFLGMLKNGNIGTVILTGNYPSAWATDDFLKALAGKFVAVIDTLSSSLTDMADIVIPGATWVEKSGTFENARGMLQSFEQAIPVIELAKAEGQIALDMIAILEGKAASEEVAMPVVVQSTLAQVASGAQVLMPLGQAFNAANIRQQMAASSSALSVFVTDVSRPAAEPSRVPDVEMVDL
jgi:NADH-quinone oxidoreductase subunit G